MWLQPVATWSKTKHGNYDFCIQVVIIQNVLTNYGETRKSTIKIFWQGCLNKLDYIALKAMMNKKKKIRKCDYFFQKHDWQIY